MTEAGIVLKVNIKEIAKLKEVAKHLDEIRAKAAAFDTVKNKIPKAKKEIKKLSEAQRELSKRTKEAENAFKTMSTKAIAVCIKLRKQIERSGQEMKTFSSRIANARRGMIMWGTRTAEMSKRVIGFGKNIQWTGRQIMMGFTLPLMYAGVIAIKTANEIMAAWVRVQKVYGDTAEEAASFAQIQKDFLIPVVDEMSLTFATARKNIVGIMGDWAAMGWAGKKLGGIVQETLMFMIAGDIEAAEATEYLRSVVAIFNLTVEETRYAMAQLNAIENATAATMRDLGEAITRVGAVSKQSGISIAELGAFVAQLRDAGVRATTVGQSLKTIIARLYGEIPKATKAVKEASEKLLGYTINMKSANFRSKTFIERIGEIGKIYKKLNQIVKKGDSIQKVMAENQKIQLSLALTGVRQFPKFATAMEGVTDATSAYNRAMEAAMDPGVVERYMREVMTVLESAPKMWARLKVSLDNLTATWGEVVSRGLMPVVKWLIGLFMALKNLDPKLVKTIFYTATFLALLGPMLMYIGFTTQAIMILAQAASWLAVTMGLNTTVILVFIAALLLLVAAIKWNIAGIGDFFKKLWGNIKGLKYELGKLGNIYDGIATKLKDLEKAGEDAGDAIGDGIASAMDNYAIMKQMEQFGAELHKQFLTGFSKIDMEILANATSIIQRYYNDLVSMNQISIEEAVKGIQNSVEVVAQAIKDSNASNEIINIYDVLKDKVGEINAEIIQSVSAAKQKVEVIEDELDIRRDAMEAAKNEYEAQKDYISFLTKTNKDISIEITTTEKKRMWVMKAKIKEIKKANLAEFQAEKLKLAALAKTASKEKEKFNLKEEELKAAKELLRIEQQIAQIRLGLLTAIRGAADEGVTDAMGFGISDFVEAGDAMEDFVSQQDEMFSSFVEGQGILNTVTENFNELGEALKKLDVLKIHKIFEFITGVVDIKTDIDAALESTLKFMDDLIAIGEHELAIEVGAIFSLNMEEMNKNLKEVQKEISKGFLVFAESAILGAAAALSHHGLTKAGVVAAGPAGWIIGTLTLAAYVTWKLLSEETKEKIKKAAKELINQFMDDFAPAIAGAIIGSWFGPWGTLIGTAAGLILTFIIKVNTEFEILEKAKKAWKALPKNLWELVTDSFKEFWGIKGVQAAEVDSVISVDSMLDFDKNKVNTFAKIFSDYLARAISDGGIGNLGEKIKNKIIGSINFAMNNLATQISEWISSVGRIGQTIATQLANSISAGGVGNLGQKIFNKTKESINFAMNNLAAQISEWETSVRMLSTRMATEIANKISDSNSGNLGWKIFNKTKESINFAMNGLASWTSEWENSVRRLSTKIATEMANKISDWQFGNLGWKLFHKMKESIKFAAREVSNSISENSGSFGESIKQSLNNLMYQAGGIVPGQISQAVPVMAHGREMILNMSQQSKLFDLLSGRLPLLQPQAVSSQQATVNYNIEFKVGNMIASPGERRAFARSIQKSLEEDNRRIGPRL